MLTTHVVRGPNASRLLFLVHGLGADERDLAGILPYLDPDGRFLCVLPRGPYSAPPGYAWFHFGSPEVTLGTIRSSLDALEKAFDDACDRFSMPRAESVVGGFSQGAVMALALGLKPGATVRPAAILSMSGFAPEGLDLDGTDPPPALMQHGTRDPLVAIDRARDAARAIASLGVPLVFQEYPMEHQVALESMRDAKAWLDRVLAGERPSEPMPEPVAEPEGAVRSVSQATFDAEVLRSDKPVIVDFWAPWCGPCRQVAPIVEQIAAMRKGQYKVVKLNIDEAPEIAQRYEIQSIPMIGLFRGGRLERRSVGAKPRPQLEAELGMLVIP